MLDCEPKNFLQPCLLLLLHEQPDHGYDLVDRLRAICGADNDNGGVYRALRSLEHQGLVVSSWRMSTTGPARRIYHLTDHGVAALQERAVGLAATRDTLDGFLERYAKVVALDSAREAR